MRTNLKNEMINMVKANATKEVNGVYEMTAKKFEAVKESLNEKFTVIDNKKDSKLHAVAYKTKKSEKLVIIKVVAETKATNNEFKFSFEMLNDKGLETHCCEFNMEAKNEKVVKNFMERLNENIKNSGLGEEALFNLTVNADNNFSGQIIFPKIAGHSKDGYANYKKCLTATKREFKIA
jgi:hypothetical protein